MEKKITLKICVGTYSYIMGGAALMSLSDELPADIKDQVKVEAAVSLPGCEEDGKIKPPFVEINGKVMGEATAEKIIEEIRKELAVSVN